MVKPCWKSIVGSAGAHPEGGLVDGLLWYKDLDHHVYGEFSMAVIQANSLLEDRGQVDWGSIGSGPNGTFVGVYDGHGGPEASQFVKDNLFANLKRLAAENQEISENVIKNAFLATDEVFLSLVKKQWLSKPQIASAGSCCLVGVISEGLIYIANAGDSRVVLGRTDRANRQVKAVQLSAEHNVNIQSEREKLQSLHSHDSQIVMLKHRVWHVKGVIQVTRSIGDAYLKKTEFNKEPLLPKYRLKEPFLKPILSPEPSMSVHQLHPTDQFLIFASDGLWEHLRNQDAADIVHKYPHYGIARRLIKAALQEAAKKREIRYSDLKTIEPGVRRHFHDDITVIVVYLNPRSSSFRVTGGN